MTRHPCSPGTSASSSRCINRCQGSNETPNPNYFRTVPTSSSTSFCLQHAGQLRAAAAHLLSGGQRRRLWGHWFQVRGFCFSEQAQPATHLLRACSISLATPAPCITSVTFTPRFSSTAAALAPCCSKLLHFGADEAYCYTFAPGKTMPPAGAVAPFLRWMSSRRSAKATSPWC